MIITIDGPVASGKSTMGRLLAKELGYYYVYSGLLYRALAYLLINTKGYNQEELHAPQMKDVLECLNPKRLNYRYDGKSQERIFFDKIAITPFLKESYIDQGASIVSTDPRVREEINTVLRLIVNEHDVVVDGRDAGTVVFPDADLKFYLTASLEVRASRWLAAQNKLGKEYTYEQAMQLLSERDSRDSKRKVAPLTIPADACIVDNSEMNEVQTLAYMLSCIQTKIN